MNLLAEGNIRKMRTSLETPVKYSLPIGDQEVGMNGLIGQHIALEYTGKINCIHCGRKTSKSFNQGYCFPCMRKLAACDSCIMSPEKCHFDQGTCREPDWGEENCMIPHYVYLANSSGLKVGITRHSQIPTRWIDQGAIEALPVLKVATRYLSGLSEVIYKSHVADKTNWRAMLKNHVDSMDLVAERDRLFDETSTELDKLIDEFGVQAIQRIDDAETTAIDYPVLEYPVKISSFNLDKTPEVSGKLMGIKGQYLILDTGVINMRKYTAYELLLSSA